MEDSWLLSTPMPLNANKATLETKEMKTHRELHMVFNEMTNTLEHFGKLIEQQKEDSFNRISQVEACLMATFEHYIYQAIPAYTEKREIGMLKSEVETLKEQNSKLRHDMCEKEILKYDGEIKRRKDQQKWKTETRQTRKDQSRQNIPLDTRNSFVPLQNTRDEVLDKETKNYKEKEILLHRHQTPVYSKQSH